MSNYVSRNFGRMRRLGPQQLKGSVWGALSLELRNTVKPSRVLRMTYSVPSAVKEGAGLEIIVEANVTERRPHRPIVQIPYEFLFRDAPLRTKVNGYNIHEMLVIKLRALFQRRRGPHFCDLYWAMTRYMPTVDPAAVIESYENYLQQEGSTAGQAEFTELIEAHLADRGFCRICNRCSARESFAIRGRRGDT